MYHFCSFNFSIGNIFPKRIRCRSKKHLLVDHNTTRVPEQRRSDKHNHYRLVITDMLGLLPARDKNVTKHPTSPLPFSRSHMERDKAAVGHRSQGVRQRHVERGGLRHQRPLPCHHRSEAESIL